MENPGPTRAHAKSMSAVHDVAPTTFPSKTDKPRPHVCGICTRGFARLEHLKRHERSHTKEKPFACNECTRCFARRDLLLRHQQKLHMSVPPSSRRRRESASSTADSTSTRVRKNSTASISSGPANAQMRPRANTISHVDNSTLGTLGPIGSPGFPPNSGIPFGMPTMNGLPGVNQHYYRGMSSATGQHGNAHVLPKIETKGHPLETSGTLRTAPPYGNFAMDGSAESAFYGGSTINPAQLHFSPSSHGFGFDSPMSPIYQGFPSYMHPTDGDAWVNNFDQHMSFGDEHAIENSSPSAVDSASPAAMSEFMTEAPSNPASSADWHQSFLSQTAFAAYSMDTSAHSIPDFRPLGPLSPKSVQMGGSDHFFSTPPPLPSNAPPATLPSQHFSLNEFAATSETPSNSTASVSSSNRQSSVTSVSTESVTEATRQALVNSLIENADKSTKTGKSTIAKGSPPTRSAIGDSQILPPLQDLQRYIGAYLKYFHPHLPFFHVPTLTFDAPAFVEKLSLNEDSDGQKHVTGGGGSLILSICAIGALYERDFEASGALFEKAKALIQAYLQQHHHQAETANVSASHSGARVMDSQGTPLWLVQAMLLNVVYGHNCGDKTTAGIASTHCAALVSLAREAHLLHREQDGLRDPTQSFSSAGGTHDDHRSWEGYISHPAFEMEKQWHAWKTREERKRTLYAIFILSSLLVSAYNSSPALMNSEISLELPCDERLWGADSAEAWCLLGGVNASQQSETSFAEALSSLLNASQRPQMQRRASKPFDSTGVRLESLPEAESKPSTFGCLILINALHNYIWETRQHHAGKEWSQQDTERLYAHMEPALQAWQLLWSSHPDHSLERPNKFGATSLSADSIPLLDLAYVRLFVNLGKSKEHFFQRDWDAMADEFSGGTEIVQHAEHSPNGSPMMGQMSPMSGFDNDQGFIELDADVLFSAPNGDSAQGKCSQKCSNRERQLRKAALCAANSLMMSDRLNVTFADFNSMELPLQSALCAFDCAQILAEWVSTLQQRVGPYLGILGQDPIHFDQAPACLILEDDDRKLLDKIKEILSSAQKKLSSSKAADKDLFGLEQGPFGSRLLNIHARMFEKEAVWPICCEMSQALRTQAYHIDAKASASLSAPA